MASRDEILIDLEKSEPTDFVSTHLFDRQPYALPERGRFIKWKTKLCRGLEVDPAAVMLVGSAAVGVSLNPTKNFKSFDATSDIDVAVISSFHFQTAWRFLKTNNNVRRTLRPAQRIAWDDHVNRLIFWGTVGADKLLPLFPFGKDWLPVLVRASDEEVGNREVKVRIYNDYDSLRSYQLWSVGKARNTLLTRKEGDTNA